MAHENDNIQASFVTDTATMCIFDLAQLQHRLTDSPDWWADQREELREVNAGNVLFVNLGMDGRYTVEIVSAEEIAACSISGLLACSSGQVFIGAAEEVTGDGLEPERVRGGLFHKLTPGTYRVTIAKHHAAWIQIAFACVEGTAVNDRTESIAL